jgi:hypothetical protein
VNWTEEQLAEFQRCRGMKPTAPKPTEKPGRLALGRLKTGEMNKTEASYAGHLEVQRGIGAVLWWKFEGIKLRLADNTFYTPDFAVMLADGTFEMHEVKGFWEDDARVKIKVAASMFPLRFIGLMPIPKGQGGGWKVEEF